MDEHMDRWIGVLLRVGVILAAVLAAAGGVWGLARNGGGSTDLRFFHGEPAELRSLTGVIGGVSSGNPLALIQLGLLVLIATPVARVVLSVFAFALRRDATYVMITLVVLGILLASMAGMQL